MTGVSTLGQILNQIDSFRSQQSLANTLLSQLNTGKITQEFSGLRNDVLTSQRSRADFDSLDTYISNITNGDRRIGLTLISVEEVQAQSETFSGSLVNFSQESAHQQGELITYDDPLTPDIEETTPVGYTSGEPDGDLTTLQDLASNLYDVVVDIINARDGDKYLLSAADSGTKPLTDTGTLDAAISSLVNQWKDGTISNDELIADLTNKDTTTNLDAISDTIIGFSSSLSSDNAGRVTIRASETVEVDYTIKANEDPFRDILVGLAFIKNADLTPVADAYIPPNTFPGVPDVKGAPGVDLDQQKENFFAVFNAVQTLVEGAIDDFDSTRFRAEAARARIDDIKGSHENTKVFLQNTIDDVENVSLDEVAIKISTLQTQLEASFAVTARIQGTSLVNFL